MLLLQGCNRFQAFERVILIVHEKETMQSLPEQKLKSSLSLLKLGCIIPVSEVVSCFVFPGTPWHIAKSSWEKAELAEINFIQQNKVTPDNYAKVKAISCISHLYFTMLFSSRLAGLSQCCAEQTLRI